MTLPKSATISEPVLTPESEEEAAALVAACAAASRPLAIRGGGTKAAVGRPVNAEATLSTRGLTGITLYEPAELVIAARAGTPLAEVERTLAERGQMLPFEPADARVLLGSEGEATVGGLAATNLSGPRRIMAGACRDAMIGVRFVNGRGEVVKSGGRVMKNVTGLDLVKLAAGAWGTLGLLTEVTFKVQPKAERSATLVIEGLDDVRGVEALNAALCSPFEITGAAHLPAALGGERALTLLRIEGFSPSVDYRVGELRHLLAPYGPAERIVDAGEARRLWQDVRDVRFLAEPQAHAVWRISTVPTAGPRVAAAIAAHADARFFYDWGGGLVWLAVPAEGDCCAEAIRKALAPHGGHTTLWRAPADIRAALQPFQPLAAPLMRLSEGIKRAVDPAGIFEPGRMYAGI